MNLEIIADEEVLGEPCDERPARIESVREALLKMADMIRQEWFFDEVAEAIAAGDMHESHLICKESTKGFVVAFSRGARPKRRETSFIKLALESREDAE